MSLTQLISIINKNSEVNDNLSSVELAVMLDQIRLDAALAEDAARTLQQALEVAKSEQNFDIDVLLNKIASALTR